MFIVAANWKMNGDRKFAQEFVQQLKMLNSPHEVIIFPPLTLLDSIDFKKGSQDCCYREYGPFTGQISADMIKETGAEYTLLGHSERREHCHETSEIVCSKAKSANKAGLKTIICVGEKEGEDFETVVSDQLKKSIPFTASAVNTVIAYEPVWAIGTGKTPTIADIEQRQKFIKDKTKLPVIYGGSVKPENAKEIANAANVDGLLVGGASLVIKDFISIIEAKK
jgi:triosephosphate isomerase